MKFVFVTYRWGTDLVGGAEIHHQRLATELADLGHEVSVVTGTGHEVAGFWHWGVQWKDVTGPEQSPFPVKRLRTGHLPRTLLALGCKLIQKRMEREEAELPDDLLQDLAGQFERGHGIALLNGWHYPEMNNGEVSRWSHPRAWIYVRNRSTRPAQVIFRGQADAGARLQVYSGTKLLSELVCAGGYVEFPCVVPGSFTGILSLQKSPVKRWARDHRTLGLWINSLELKSEDRDSYWTDLREDFRTLGRRVPEKWQAWLLDRADKRPSWAGRLFDQLRGPRLSGLRSALPAPRNAVVIHCNLPWSTVSSVRTGDLVMPLWHIDDEFYYWRHWISAMRRARFALANTPYTAEHFFPPLGIRAHFVGPPIWEPAKPEAAAVSEFRRANEISDDEVLVLTVCRKSGEKRYDAVASAVAKLRAQQVPVRMIGIGPDIDGIPLSADGCRWLGKLGGEDLQRAYSACDIFALLSESESFGMVIPEAWHHGKPVVVNRLCQPAASLLSEGEDGLAVAPGAELEEAIRSLASNPERRVRMGEAGRRKAMEHYVRGAAAKRLIKGLEE